ncbi:MAG: hypothetical protein M3Y82_12140, partial [Verrucomicrobiota bacterium]|nr:hypothetical protein [Verrucomicrobiota bacterium]
MKAAEILSRLECVKKTADRHVARCKAHNDKTPSLSITEKGNRVLLKCFAGCTTESVCAAMGITLADLFTTEKQPRNGSPKPHIVAIYDYRDESGKLLLQAVRFEPKDFRQRAPDATAPDGWRWTTKDVRRVLYRLPEIIRDVQRGLPIVICEGEKDADALAKLGFSATCNLGGAGKWRTEYSETLRGAQVFIIADKDEPGRAHAQAVALSLHGVASFVAVLELPDRNGKACKDISDFIFAGATVADIQTELDAAKKWTPLNTETTEKSFAVPEMELPVSQGSIEAETPLHFKNDIGFADAFVQRHAGTIRYCSDEACWLLFDKEEGWRRDAKGEVKSLFAAYARELYNEALKAAAGTEPELGNKMIARVAALGNKKRIDPALSFAQCSAAIVVRADELDSDPYLVGVKNGVVNLKDGTFQPHCPENLVTRRLDVTFDGKALAPIWEKFLQDVQPSADMRSFLRRLVGYSLTGDIREHVLPFHYGTGANGKGTFLEQTLLKLCGSYGAKLTDSLVFASDRGAVPHLEIANL